MISNSMPASAVEAAVDDRQPLLRLPSATGLRRAYLVLHTPTLLHQGGRGAPNAIDDLSDPNGAVRGFIAELYELSGMTVVA